MWMYISLKYLSIARVCTFYADLLHYVPASCQTCDIYRESEKKRLDYKYDYIRICNSICRYLQNKNRQNKLKR